MVTAHSFSPEQAEGDHGHQCRRGGVDEVVPEQHDAQELVDLGEQLLRESRAAVALVGEVLQSITVERHHAGLGNGKERRDQEADGKRNQQRRYRDVVQSRDQRMECGRPTARAACLSAPAQQYLQHELAAEVGEHEGEKAGQRPAHGDATAPAVDTAARQQRRENSPREPCEDRLVAEGHGLCRKPPRRRITPLISASVSRTKPAPMIRNSSVSMVSSGGIQRRRRVSAPPCRRRSTKAISSTCSDAMVNRL